MSIDCYIITLEPDSERTRDLVSALERQDIPVHLVSAVDGRGGFPLLEPNEKINQPKALRRHLATPTASQVGCYLSHYRLIRSAFERGQSAICVLEDDVMIEPAFGTVLKRLEHGSWEFDLVRLMGLRIRRRKVVGPLIDGPPGESPHAMHRLVRPERGWCGCQSYIVNRTGMQKIIRQGAAIYEPIDKLIDHFWEFDLQVLGVEPHVAFERPHPSSVQQNSVERRQVTVTERLLYRLTKGALSLRRHSYLLRNRQDFYPAEKPPTRPGRTQRMR